jgi:hypothetical protein
VSKGVGEHILGLFGNYEFNKKKENISCLDMTKSMFPDDMNLIKEIGNYLRNRKIKKNMPKKKAWECQLKLLEKVPKEQRANQVHRATERGWMAIAFEDSNKYTNKSIDTSVTRNKANENNIVDIEF